MEFSKLVKLFDSLSKTTKRLEMTSYLTEFLKKVECKEIGFVVLLVMGRVFPINVHKEIGVANNMMINALALASGRTKKEIMELLKKKGDMGEVAEELLSKKRQNTLVKDKITIDLIKNSLYKLAEIEGKGSVDKKLKIIAKLLNSATPREALYITRIILGNMRTGVGKGIVRDALSNAFNIEAKKIEDAYNLCTDYSLVAETLCKDPQGISKIGLTLFHPINVMLFQKVRTISEAFERVGKPAIIEIKYDGIRAQIHKKGEEVRLFTRNLDEVTKQFPDAVEYVKKWVDADEVIFECEMVAYDKKKDRLMEFQNISKRVKRKYDIKEIMDEIGVKMFCFDLLLLNGKNLLNSPFEERHNLLKSIIKPNDHIMLAEGIKTDSEEEAKKMFKKGIKIQEGVMFKNLKAKYQAGSRVGYGVKLKSHMKELDLVIVEAFYGKGRRKDWFGSFTLACYDEDSGEYLTIGKLGTGFTDKQFKDINEKIKRVIEEEKEDRVLLKPQIVVEVEYEEIQKSPTYTSGYALRFPRLVRFRPDKRPDEASTIKMVRDLVKS